jgi:hypothetical protein
MFAYNPQVNDRSGEIYGAHQVDAAKAQAAGMQSFGKSIGDGLQSAGSSIAGGMTKAGETRIASDGVNAKFDMLKGIKKSDGSNLISQDIIDKFDTMPLGKRQGIVSTADSLMDYDLKQWMYGVQYNAQNNRLTQAQLQNQVPANQQPYTPPAQQANPAGNINMNFVTQPQQQQ